MAISRAEIQVWFDDGVKKGATHMIVLCDTFDWEDYPHYVMPGSDPREYKPGSMQKVMEVYAMHLDRDSQINERRSFHYETPN